MAKGQVIRLIDVFYIGVILIWIAVRFDLPALVKVQLIIIGVATILYNAYNYIEEYKIDKRIEKNKYRMVHVSDLNVQEHTLRRKLKENYDIKLTY